MNTTRYRSFRYRLSLSFIVWFMFVCLFFLLSGFRTVPGEQGLHNVFVMWLLSLTHVRSGLPVSSFRQAAGMRISWMFCLFVLPAFTAAWASPLMGTGHLPGMQEADFSDPHATGPSIFYLPLERYRSLSWGACARAKSPWALWLLSMSLATFVGFLGPRFDAIFFKAPQYPSPGVGEGLWLWFLWTLFLSLLPGTVRRILDLRATRRALLNQPSREE